MGLGLLVVGMVGLVAVLDWQWYSGSVARQAREAQGRPVVIEGALDADGTWPPLIRAEQVRMGVFDWSWIKGYVVRKASETLGRMVFVEGALDVDWSWPPLIRAEQVRETCPASYTGAAANPLARGRRPNENSAGGLG